MYKIIKLIIELTKRNILTKAISYVESNKLTYTALRDKANDNNAINFYSGAVHAYEIMQRNFIRELKEIKDE
ncbi:MAG: hypothetical protein J6S85_26705 [Methanobrevibacter sp.]|nr:hypothetical protein [Methanobrevibacter sp.]MBO7717186.1 hypothetical protein [Methanobrevibacter sp.]